MKKNTAIFFLSLCVLLVLSGCAGRETPSQPPEAPSVEPAALDAPAAPQEEDEPEPAPVLSPREQGWIDDINYLREQYKELHKDPFYWCSEEEFDLKLDQICEKVEELSDNDIYFELAAVIAGMGDGHTCFDIPDAIFEERFPIGAAYVGDHAYLYGYMAGYDQFAPYQLHEIVAINGVDIVYIQRKLNSFRNPYNTWNSRMYFQVFFAPAFLDWAGCNYREGYTIQVLNDNREVVSLELPVLSSEAFEAGEWIRPESAPTKAGGNWCGYIQDEAGGCLFISFRDMTLVTIREDGLDSAPYLDLTPYLDFADEIQAVAAAHPDCKKLVVDIRRNVGGQELANTCLRRLKLPGVEQTYVLVDGGVASAAISCIPLLKRNWNAVTVGEPVGQFSSFLGYRTNPAAEVTLPVSGLSMRCSDAWKHKTPVGEEWYDEDGRLYPWESTILPDVYVPQTIEDILQGKDSVMEWVLAQ